MSVYKIFILFIFNREYMERNVMTSFRLCLHSNVFYVILKQNDQFFLPFSVNCSQVAMFQIMPASCLHGQGADGWSTKCGQTWTGGGGSPKFPNLCGHALWMTSYIPIFCLVCVLRA